MHLKTQILPDKTPGAECIQVVLHTTSESIECFLHFETITRLLPAI